MKKFGSVFALAIVLALCCFVPTGCSNGFKMVKSITITTGGETKTFGTTTSPILDFTDLVVYDLIENPYADEEKDFAAAPEERKFYDIAGGERKQMTTEFQSKMSTISFDDAVKAAKGDTYYEIVEPELEGYYYFKSRYTPTGNTYYSKMKYIKTHFNFTYVNIKSDTTIVIKSGKSETTYQVTSYKIEEL